MLRISKCLIIFKLIMNCEEFFKFNRSRSMKILIFTFKNLLSINLTTYSTSKVEKYQKLFITFLFFLILI